MATEIWAFQVTVPPSTPIANPQTTNMLMTPSVVQRIEIRIPPGPRGQVGFALAAAGRPMLPSNSGQWFVGDDERLDWTVEEQITSGAWQLQAYNIGAQAHTLYIRFHLESAGRRAELATGFPLIPLAQLTPR